MGQLCTKMRYLWCADLRNGLLLRCTGTYNYRKDRMMEKTVQFAH